MSAVLVSGPVLATGSPPVRNSTVCDKGVCGTTLETKKPPLPIVPRPTTCPLALSSNVTRQIAIFDPEKKQLTETCSAMVPTPCCNALQRSGFLVKQEDLKLIKCVQRDSSGNWSTSWAFPGSCDARKDAFDICSRSALSIVPSFVCHGLTDCGVGDCLHTLESADVLTFRQYMLGRAAAINAPGLTTPALLARVVESDLRLAYDCTKEKWKPVIATLDDHTSVEMCASSYALLSGLTGTAWKNLRARITAGHSAGTIVVPKAAQGAKARKTEHSLDWSLLSGYVRSLLQKWESNPAPGAAHQSGQVYIDKRSWKEKWSDCRKVFFEHDPHGRVPGSQSMLKRVWRLETRLKEKKACSHSKCSTCSKIAAQLQALFGVKGDLADTTRGFLLRARGEHDELHLGRRHQLDDAGFLAYTDPKKMWCLVADAATQANFLLPRFKCRKPKDLVGKPFWGYKLSAVYAYGYGFMPFLTHKSQKAGPNLVWTTIWISLCRMRDHYGFWPQILHITVDNTTGENKTGVTLWFCAWLVKSGKVKQVRLLFLMVGHTHIIIDQIFGTITIGLKAEELLTPDELAENINRTMAGQPEHKAHKVTFLNSVWDMTAWTQTMEPDDKLKKLFKADLDDELGEYDGMYDFVLNLVGSDARLQYREEITHQWRPEGQGAMTIAKLPDGPPPLQELYPFEKWGKEDNATISGTMQLCYSLLGGPAGNDNKLSPRKLFSEEVLKVWESTIAAIPASVDLLPDDDKLKFRHLNNTELPRLAGPSHDEDEGSGEQGPSVDGYHEWLKTSGICIRSQPFAIDPVESSEQSSAEFQRKKAEYQEQMFKASVPVVYRYAPVFSGQFILVSGSGSSGVNLFKVVHLGKLNTPSTVDLSCYVQKYKHTPNPEASGLFGTFSLVSSKNVSGNHDASRRWVKRSEIVVFNAHLVTTQSKLRILTLDTLRCLSVALPEAYPFPKDQNIPDSHVELLETELDDEDGNDRAGKRKRGGKPVRSSKKRRIQEDSSDEEDDEDEEEDEDDEDDENNEEDEEEEGDDNDEEDDEEDEEDEADEEDDKMEEDIDAAEAATSRPAAVPGDVPRLLPPCPDFKPNPPEILFFNMKGDEEADSQEYPVIPVFVHSQAVGRDAYNIYWYDKTWETRYPPGLSPRDTKTRKTIQYEKYMEDPEFLKRLKLKSIKDATEEQVLANWGANADTVPASYFVPVRVCSKDAYKESDVLKSTALTVHMDWFKRVLVPELIKLNIVNGKETKK